MAKFFKEKLYQGLIQKIKIKKFLISKKSKFQKIEIFDTELFGRVLALDGIIQITEKDEAAYSEMLVHPAIQSLNKKSSNVLIIGGGDGAVAEEVLKYNFIKNIDLVDIDEEVVNLSKKYFKKINKNSLNNNKLKIFYEDALLYVKHTSSIYDIVIADRPDPIGAGRSLYKLDFYENIKNIMSKNSLAIFQSGVPFLQKNELREVLKDVKIFFKYSGCFLTVVPSYIGGFMTLVWASNNTNLLKEKKFLLKNNLKTQYYNKEILMASFALPNFIKKL